MHPKGYAMDYSAQKFTDLTVEHLGDGATQATLDQFLRACDAVIDQHPAILNWNDDGTVIESEVIDWVWNDGLYDKTIADLLGEEVAQ